MERPGFRPDPELIVTDAGYDCITLRQLVREAIPVLANPGGYTVTECGRIADALRTALEATDTEDIPIGESDEERISVEGNEWTQQQMRHCGDDD